MSRPTGANEGWGWPIAPTTRSSVKMHYFVGDTGALCRRWPRADGPLQGVDFDAVGECLVCRAKLAKRLRRKR